MQIDNWHLACPVCGEDTQLLIQIEAMFSAEEVRDASTGRTSGLFVDRISLRDCIGKYTECICKSCKEIGNFQHFDVNKYKMKYTAIVSDVQGRALYVSGEHETREAAAAEAFKARPKAKRCATGYGYRGRFDIQWTERPKN
jgi:hypothetical protein